MKQCFLMVLILLSSACVNRDIAIKEHTVQAVLWQQNAAEYRALCHQAFNIAHAQLKQMVKEKKTQKPLAIITDLDETILDNSPYSVILIDGNANYSQKSWNQWGRKEAAQLLPGAADFLKDVHDLGVEIFYVSNRSEQQTTETLNNLRKYHLPNVDESHLYLKSETSSKKQRRAKINETHEILMLLGDNLSDFHEIFEDQDTASRNQLVTDQKQLFGQKFIVFPNPMYGDWESDGIYNGQRYDEANKRQIRSRKLRR